MEKMIDLHDVANHLNKCLEESPTVVYSFLQMHVVGSRKDAEGRTFGFPIQGDSDAFMFNILGLLSGMGDGLTMIVPVQDAEGKLVGFKVKPVNTSTGGNINEI